jgi:selenide,water dikinase
MGPAALAQVLRPLAETFDASSYPDLLRGLSDPDDAAVWRIDEHGAMVLTADFFPPVVDDPYDYGAIAAANSLSDLYAMGARPLMAINLVSFPRQLPTELLAEILRGGAEKVREAGAVIAGGHTTDDPEPKYGLAVTGWVDPAKVWTKGGALPGDVLLLTKPLGTGLVTTALKQDRVDPADLAAAVASMSRLHRRTVELIAADPQGVHAVTDVTGFGLPGHGHEMAEQSGLALRIVAADLPLLPGVERYAEAGHATGGGRRNDEYYGPYVRFAREPEPWQRAVWFDPQTSGGLLIAAAPAAAARLARALAGEGEPCWAIGETVDGPAGTIELV